MRITEPAILHLVVLNFSAMKGEPEPTVRSIIAHEIAHFLLGHSLLADSTAENQADDLIEQWGFERQMTKRQTKRGKEVGIEQ